jgi:enoyl-CoA hydratase/carnithine racemase
VVATEDSKFGTPEIDLGLWPMMISAVLLPMVSRRTLLEMMMTGRIISASDAKQIGIVSRVVPADTLDESVAETVATLLSKSSAALALGKESFYATGGMDMDSALDPLHIGLTATALTEDAVEGVSAFIDGRDATWKGR